ncbi:hypothetical protein DPMN_009005 [Dreissena polymorpha]|uniref:G-protein coupled receptors family 1 profile domain-containing protein n=1 Tax=Dreissena polymorpha TaxID=45954 RepID=A0A9D4MW99_DREPO|nr:hypothetical protein DPMN_009005 [Dreissena polymorpha]
MKRSSCSVFLAALAAADNMFIIGVLLTYFNENVYAILTKDIACQLLIFITYVGSFLSVSFIVGFTCERYIAMQFPLKCKLVCSVGREKVVVLILTIFACAIYSFSFWTTVASPFGDMMQCTFKFEYFRFLKIVTWLDTCITMIIPFLLITCINALVIRRFWKRKIKTATRPQLRRLDQSAELNPSLLDASHRRNRDGQSVCMSRTQVSSFAVRVQWRVTRNLLFVSLTFLGLNLPSYLIRLYSLVVSEVSQENIVSAKLYFFKELTQMLYCSTFACNVFIYTLSGRNFRKSLLRMIRCNSEKHYERKRMLKRLLSVQRQQHHHWDTEI